MSRLLHIIGKIVLFGFAIIGFITTAVFVAMRFDLLNVRGSIDERNQFFLDAYQEQVTAGPEGAGRDLPTPADSTFGRIVRLITANNQTPPIQASTSAETLLSQPCTDPTATTCPWTDTPEWLVIKSGLEKDLDTIVRVETETGINRRLIAAVVLPEQARFFSSNREVFKRWFEPMKLLGSLSQFSLGVSGIKQETANQIESYATDPTSEFYPGDHIAPLIMYEASDDHDTVLFERLTDEDNHYFSYLYTALYIKEVLMQWERAGIDISNRPEIIVTLFNLGFDKSQPHPNPQAGGATLTIGNTDYTYGTLGGLFYYSDELQNTFPR